MRFVELRITGFKSFVEPVRIAIEPGLTGVVGPNGCGKSNLFEALRWVMGATSAKALRGEGMADVIFAGSSGRAARNWAEVVIVVEPGEKTAPPPFDKADRLEISRRIDRDGGSTYRINGKEVRARDVTVLFADNATGANSAALVRQGQVAELIAAKPKNRRLILEEAAGISGLHQRRREAEQRLKAAEQNLERLGDVIHQIEIQHKNLERQAKEASKYRLLNEDVRGLEARLAILRFLDAAGAAEKAKAVLDAARETVGEAEAETARMATKQAEAASALAPARDEHAVASAVLQRMEIERDTLDAQAKRLADAQEAATARAEQAAQDAERELVRAKEARTQIDALEAKLEDLVRERDAEGDAAVDARDKAERTEEARKDAEKALEDASRTHADAEAARSAAERALKEADERKSRVERDLEARRAERDALQDDDRAVRALADAKLDVEHAEAAAEDAEHAAGEAETEVQEAEARLGPLRKEARDARERLGAVQSEAQGLERLLAQQSTDGDGAALADALHVEPGFEKAVGAALGDDIQAGMDAGAPRHWGSVRASASDAAPLPAGARPLRDVVGAPETLDARLAHIGVVEAAAGPALQADLKPGQRLVSKAGDLWRWDGFVAAADAPSYAVARLEQKNRLAALQKDVAAAETASAAKRAAADEAQTALDEAKTREKDARLKAREAAQALARARDKVAEFETDAARRETRLSALGDVIDGRTAELDEARAAHADARSRLASAAPSEETAQNLDQARAKAAEARAEAAEARAAHAALARESDARARAIKEAEAARTDWTARAEEADALSGEMRRRQRDAEEELSRLSAEPKRIEEQKAKLFDRIAEAEQRRDAASDALARADTAAREADKTLREAERKASDAREARGRADGGFETARERLLDATRAACEQLGVGTDALEERAAEALAGETESVAKVEKDLDRARSRRDALGAVNLRAEDEAAEYQARLEALFTDRADLEAAIGKLRSGINDLNKEGRERLLAAYEEVRGHFASLFTELFQGGEARLDLVESDDPLEAGLEIHARPPGKRMGSMSLMSGGEQALTATALIFAVFLSNPAPICVLDEVDAPLDDTNVDRFCRLMDRMSRETDTRFLCITHHALSMSRMDRLFGVTMAERGVSQLVSVDLAKAEELVAA